MKRTGCHWLILAGVSLFSSMVLTGGEFFPGLDRGNQIYGKDIKTKDLKGKVIFFEYWGVHCPPCRASFPHLVELQKKYGKTGKFTVLASHVQSTSDEAKEFCQEKKVNFPVFHQYRNPSAKTSGGIPHAFLIDHNGKIVKEGHPSVLYNLVGDLVKAAPDPIPPVLGEVKAQFWKSQAKSLASGKAAGPILNSLKQASTGDTPRAQEAAAIIKAVESYLEKRSKELETMAKTEPSKAFIAMKGVLKQAAGTKFEGPIKEAYVKLSADVSVKALANLRIALGKVQASLEKRETRGGQKKLADLKAKIAKFSKKQGISAEVAAEASALADSL